MGVISVIGPRKNSEGQRHVDNGAVPAPTAGTMPKPTAPTQAAATVTAQYDQSALEGVDKDDPAVRYKAEKIKGQVEGSVSRRSYDTIPMPIARDMFYGLYHPVPIMKPQDGTIDPAHYQVIDSFLNSKQTREARNKTVANTTLSTAMATEFGIQFVKGLEDARRNAQTKEERQAAQWALDSLNSMEDAKPQQEVQQRSGQRSTEASKQADASKKLKDADDASNVSGMPFPFGMPSSSNGDAKAQSQNASSQSGQASKSGSGQETTKDSGKTGASSDAERAGADGEGGAPVHANAMQNCNTGPKPGPTYGQEDGSAPADSWDAMHSAQQAKDKNAASGTKQRKQPPTGDMGPPGGSGQRTSDDSRPSSQGADQSTGTKLGADTANGTGGQEQHELPDKVREVMQRTANQALDKAAQYTDAVDQLQNLVKGNGDARNSAGNAGTHGTSGMLRGGASPDEVMDVARNSNVQDILKLLKGMHDIDLESKKKYKEEQWGEYTGYKVGAPSDFKNVVPTEMAQPDEVFYDKVAREQFMLYERGVQEGKGPMYVLVDRSGSMQGQKMVWAKAVALALYEQAKKEGRTFYFRFFDDVPYDQQRVMNGNGGASALAMINYIAQMTGDNGTDIQKAVETACDDMKSGVVKDVSQVIVITDGGSSLDINRLRMKLKQSNAAMISVMIQGDNDVLKSTSNAYMSVNQLDANSGLKIVDLSRQMRKQAQKQQEA